MSLLLLLVSTASGLVVAPAARAGPTRLMAAAREPSTLLETEHLASLGRLAAKFGHAAPETIEEIRVSRVTLSEIELEVLSCEATSCVSLSLPIAFPRQCAIDEDFTECVLDNVRSLEAMCPADVADKETHTSARFVTHFEAEGKPEWWVDPVDDDLKHASADARDVLNANDFHADLVAFASRLAASPVQAARVEHCGPAGLVIAVSTENSERSVVDFRFPRLCETPAELRKSLLGAIAEPPAPTVVEKSLPQGLFHTVSTEGLDDDFVSSHPLVADLFGAAKTFSIEVDDAVRLRADDDLLTLHFDKVTPATLRGQTANLRLAREDDSTFLVDLGLPEDRYILSFSLVSDHLRFQVFPQANDLDAASHPRVLTKTLARV